MVPSPDCKNYNSLIIRHAFSEYNYVFESFLTDTGKNRLHDDSKHLRFNIQYVDSELHQLGVEQAWNLGRYLNNFNIKVVFISPMLRTLRTAFFLNKYHIKSDKIKWIVLPQLAEVLSMSSSI